MARMWNLARGVARPDRAEIAALRHYSGRLAVDATS